MPGRAKAQKTLSSILGSAVKAAVPNKLVKSSKKLAPALSRPPAKSLSQTANAFSNSDSLDSGNEASTKHILKDITNMLCGNSILGSSNVSSSQTLGDGKSLETVLGMQLLSNMHQNSIPLRRKELSRERKQKWVFKNTQTRRLARLVETSAKKLGTEATLEIFSKLRRETGMKEYNALIKICMEKARESNDDLSIGHAQKAFELLQAMNEEGFLLEEETYSPLLVYLTDTGRIEEFNLFCDFIKDANPESVSRLGYYEILLWIRVNNVEKVQELLHYAIDHVEDASDLAVSYLLALCEADKKKELLQLLEVVDVSKISSMDSLTVIFRSFGRLSLESFAEKSILAFKRSEKRDKDISSFICSYITSMPNLVVGEVISRFNDFHEKYEVVPSSASYEKLITYTCDLHQVRAALDIVDQMCQSGVALSLDTFKPILHAIEQNLELHLVLPIYSMMRHYDLKPDCETFRSLISLCVKMKHFEGAYNILKDVGDLNMVPTSNMYNSIMAGYFRQKNSSSALMVLNQMKNAKIKPDSETFCFLIGNSECEEDIVKYCNEMKHAEVAVTKHVTMALINAYANCGQFEKAKQVVLDQGMSGKNSEIKSVLVSALASNGKIADALELYEESRQAGWHLEPKAAICLIENLHCEGELNNLLQLLGELNDPSSWFDGCGRVVLYCVRHKLLSSATDLLKQLKESVDSEVSSVFDQIFSLVLETEPADLETGLHLLHFMKEDLGLCPSRTHLDFLLSACVSAKDRSCAELIWGEYRKAGLSMNVLTFLRKYQVLLATGEHAAAVKLLKSIHKDDPHVRSVIRACDATYCTTSVEEVEKKKSKNKLAN